MGCIDYYTEKLTEACGKLDEGINNRSLTDIPVKEWRIFEIVVNLHLALASILFIAGCVCFCIGLKFSIMFDAVNCSDGVNIFPPMINLMGAFTGLFTLRTLHLKWPAFIHLISTFIVLPLNLITAIDLFVNSAHWSNYWSNYPNNIPELSTSDWSTSFLWMDIGIAFIAILNDIACSFILFIYFKFWYPLHSLSTLYTP